MRNLEALRLVRAELCVSPEAALPQKVVREVRDSILLGEHTQAGPKRSRAGGETCSFRATSPGVSDAVQTERLSPVLAPIANLITVQARPVTTARPLRTSLHKVPRVTH